MAETRPKVPPKKRAPHKRPYHHRQTVAEQKAEASKHKNRGGKDLVLLFYTLVLIVLAVTTIQVITYHVGLYGQASFLYPYAFPVYQFLGMQIDVPNFRLQMFSIPIDIVINSLTLYTLGYGGFEGSKGLISSLSMPSGQMAALPDYKIRRFFAFIVTWLLVVLVLTAYQTILRVEDTKYVSFFLKETFTGFCSACVIYLYGRQAPKVAEHVGPPLGTVPDPVVIPPPSPTPAPTPPPVVVAPVVVAAPPPAPQQTAFPATTALTGGK